MLFVGVNELFLGLLGVIVLTMHKIGQYTIVQVLEKFNALLNLKNTSNRILLQNTVKDFCNCMFSIGTLHQVKTLKSYSGLIHQEFCLLNKVTQKLMLCKSLQFI